MKIKRHTSALLICVFVGYVSPAYADGLAFSFRHDSDPTVSAANERPFDGFGFSYDESIKDRMYWKAGIYKSISSKTRLSEWRGQVEIGVYLFGGE
jgi:hypothetical protein